MLLWPSVRENYREALPNFWLAAKGDELQEVLNGRDFDEWPMPGVAYSSEQAVNRHGNR